MEVEYTDSNNHMYRKLKFRGAEIIVYIECNLKFSGEGLAAVDITTPEGHFKIQDT